MAGCHILLPGGAISLPVIPPLSYAAIPLHLTQWEIRVRPQGWGLKFCSNPLAWYQPSGTNDLRQCKAMGGGNQEPFRLVSKMGSSLL